MAIDKIFKGNTTIAGATIGTIGTVRSISINQTQGTYDSTAADTTTARTYLSTWGDGTATVAGLYDPNDSAHNALETYADNETADTITITFESGETWAASCIVTGLTIEGDYEGGWTFSCELQKSGDATWTHV